MRMPAASCEHGVIDAICWSCSVEKLVVNDPLQMLQHRTEIIPFCVWLKEQRVDSVLEIGTGPGGTTYLWGKLARGTVISVDLPGHGAMLTHTTLMDLLANFHSVLGDSHLKATQEFVRYLLSGELVDLLFIDGDHSLLGVAQDFKEYRQFVKPGGWAAFHDINAADTWPDMGVPTFWRSLEGEKLEWSGPPGPDSWGGIGAMRI